MNYWVTTDTHLNHGMLVERCLRIPNYEDLIFASFKKLLQKEDVLIHLGDVSFGNDIEWNEKIMEIECTKWLILGNHDKRGLSWYFSRGWDAVCNSLSLVIFGQNILFSHIPQKDYGFDMNIHGHFHNNDHRCCEPGMVEILTHKHVLLALENNKYELWNLRSIVDKFVKDSSKLKK